jgi:hypothetical protein
MPGKGFANGISTWTATNDKIEEQLVKPIHEDEFFIVDDVCVICISSVFHELKQPLEPEEHPLHGNETFLPFIAVHVLRKPLIEP